MLAGLIAAGCCQAGVPALFDKSDAVVTGTSAFRALSENTVTFTIQVAKAYKGPVSSGDTLTVEWTASAGQPLVGYRSSFTGAWFLTQTEIGWRTSAVRSALGMPGASFPIATADAVIGDPVQDIMNQIAAAEVAAEAPHAPFLLQAAEGKDSEAMRQVFQSFLGASSPRLRCIGFSGLLQRSDAPALSQFASQARALAADPSCGVAFDLGAAYRSTDPSGIAVLGALAVTKSDIRNLQSFALMALSAIHTRETLPFLVQIMNGPDEALHKQAVIGIGWFANGNAMQTPQGEAALEHLNRMTPNAFTTADTKKYLGFDEARAGEFIGFWNNWWNANRSALGY